MIVTTTHHLSLAKGYDKVQYLFPVLNNTFLFLAHRESGCDVLVHCSPHGKALFELAFEHMVDSIAVPSPYEAVALQTRKNTITHLDLQTHALTHLPFQFLREESDQSLLECFSQTHLLCVVEWGLHNDPRLKLTYFRHPLLAHPRPLVVFESRDDEWTYEYYIRRVNNRSMIAWFKARQEEFEIRLFEVSLEEKASGAMRVVKSEQSLASFYGLSQCECDLLQVWETTPGSFMLVVLSGRSDMVKGCEKAAVNNLMVLDGLTGRLRECRFCIPRPYNDLALDHTYLGYYSMVRTFLFENSRAKQSPVYFLNNATEQLIAEDTWECTHLLKDTVPGYDASLLVSAEYENEDVHAIDIHLKTPADPRMLGLHLLLEIYDDFDENFLQQALQFLPAPTDQR